MKSFSTYVALVLVGVCYAHAQMPAIETSGDGSTLVVYQEIERGPHHKVVQSVIWETNAVGDLSVRTNSYTELATGMHYLQAEKWLESEAKIEILPNNAGAAASNGQHKVLFPPEIESGIIELQMPDNQWLRSRVWGLSYFDEKTHESVLLATVKKSEGHLVGENAVIYPDAFTDIQADIRYTYTLAGFEQDVVLRQQPPAPETFGLSSKTTLLQVLTEFVESPMPAKESRQADGIADESLNFELMGIGQGKAFSVDAAGDTSGQVPVAKGWAPTAGRDFLIEEVHYEKVTEQLQKLPAAAKYQGASLLRRGSGTNVLAGLKQLLPRRYAKSTPKPATKRMAKATPQSSPGFVMDYLITLTSQANFTFKANTTYYVSGAVNLSGTTTIEGGTVVKYANSTAVIVGGSGLVCKTGPYRPAIFTSKFDNSVGEVVATGTPAVLPNAVFLNSLVGTNPFKYLYFRYAGTGLAQNFRPVWHCQFVHCNKAISGDPQGPYGATMELHNVLFSDCSVGVFNNPAYWYGSCLGIKGEHVTADQVGALMANTCYYGDGLNHPYGIPTSALTNSILTAVGNLGVTISLLNAINTASSSGYYQSAGAGNYYLTDVARATVGTPDINPTLLGELAKKTTYPPELHNSGVDPITIPSGTSWSQFASRDTDTPDIGYHYDPLDHLVGNATLNGTLTVSAGTTVGFFGPYAFQAGTFQIAGTPVNRSAVAHYSAVQEQPVAWGANASVTYLLKSSSMPALNWRFADVTTAGGAFFGGGSATSMDVAHCSLLAPRMSCDGGFYATLGFTNNIIERGDFVLLSCYGGTYYANFYNNLFLNNANLGLGHACDQSIIQHFTIKNNLFVNSSFTYGTFSGYAPVIANNGFYNTTVTSQGTTPKNITTLDFQNGALGNYYYPTTVSGQNLATLIDSGTGTPAQAGLYHYTVKNVVDSKEGKDAVQTVDIGFHYVGVNGLGNPMDTDRDSLADYFEDSNGSGDTDLGETSWVPTVSIATTDPDAYEDGHDPGTLTITRTTDNLAVPLTVLVQMSGLALEGIDYFPVGTQVTIQPNDTTADVFICPYTDFFATEGDESVTVTLQNSSDYRIAGTSSAALNIIDGSPPADQVVSVELARANACENSGQPGSFTIWRTGGSLTGPLTVNFQLTGTATEGTDYSTVGTQVTIPANASSASVAIKPLPDTITEVSESAVLVLQPGSQYTLGSSVAVTVNLMDTCAENGSYVYPLMPGTASWINATPEERVASAVIPQSWRNTATSWQLFCSAIGNPYFRSASLGGYDLSATYAATRVGTVPVLSDVDGAADFGVNVIRFMEELNVTSIKTSNCGDSSLCGIDYRIFCYMAGLDASLNTMNQASRQKLFRLAVWDAADFCGSQDTDYLAACPMRLIYIIYNKPEAFRGAFPPGVTLPALTPEQSAQMDAGSLPEELIPAVYSVKTALGLVSRP